MTKNKNEDDEGKDGKGKDDDCSGRKSGNLNPDAKSYFAFDPSAKSFIPP